MFSTLIALSALLTPASAQEEPPGGERKVQALEDANASLTEALAAARAQAAALAAGSAERAALEALISAGVTLIDDRQPLENRAAAAETLSLSGSPWALPFLRVAARDRDAEVQLMALSSAVNLTDPDTADIGKMAARQQTFAMAVREAGLVLLADIQTPSAAQALWDLANDEQLTGSLRRSALELLETRYPAVLEDLGRPDQASDSQGAFIGVLGNTIAGGVMLSAVGTWGQFDAGPAIGGVGGSLIGIGAGIIYVSDQSVSDGQGLAYASGVGWGLTAGTLLTTSLHGTMNQPTSPSRDELGALYRVAGVSGGALLGWQGVKRDPDAVDVLEMDISGYLGFQLGRGFYDLKQRSFDAAPGRAASTLAGTAAGLGAGVALQEFWDLDSDDFLFATVVLPEAIAVGLLMPEALGREGLRSSGLTRLVSHGSLAAAFTFSEFVHLTPAQSGMAGFGTLVGNGLGAGLPMLLGAEDGQSISRVMIPMGVTGLLTGPALSNALAPDSGDWSMIGVGSGLALIESLTLASVAESRGLFKQGNLQETGMILVTTSAVAGGLSALSPLVDPDPRSMAFLGSSALWGAWYGTMIPAALSADWDTDDYLLSGTLTGDAFLIAGGALISPAVGLKPADTLGAQLGGLSGATLGALGAAMFTNESSTVASASVAGTAAGMVTGGLVTRSRRARGKSAGLIPMPDLSLPGTLRPTFAPMTDEDGGSGLYLGLSLDNW